MNLSRRIAELLIRHRAALAILAGVLALASLWPASRLQFDRSIESIFPRNDPRLQKYEHLRDTFGGNEIVLAVYEDDNLFAPDASGIQRVTEVRKKLERVPGVKAVLSIDRPWGEDIVDPEDKVAKRLRELFAGYTHGPDGRTVALACMLQPRGERDVPRRETIDGLRNVVRNELPAPLEPGMIAGEPVMVSDGFRFVEADGARLGWATTALLAVVIVVSFRSLRWVIIPVVIVQLTLLWTKASLVVSRLQLSMVSSMLTAVVTVIGIATVVHVIVRFREARNQGLSPQAALTQALALLIVPIVWACATDAAGFASLLITDVGPVQDFGLMMAIGALLVIAAVVLTLPAMVLLGNVSSDPQRAWGEGLLDGELRRIVGWVEHRPWPILLAVGAVTILAAIGLGRLQVESDFTKNFRADSNIVQSYNYVENRLGGAGVWDVMVPAPERLDVEYLRRLKRLESRLNEEVVVTTEGGEQRPGLTKTLSLAGAVDAADPRFLDEDARIPVPPFSPFSSDYMRKVGIKLALDKMEQAIPEFYRALHAEDPQHKGRYWFRIMLRSREQQPAQAKKQIIEQVQRIVDEEFPAEEEAAASPKVTGFFVLLAYLIDRLLADQWMAFGVACCAIALMMLIVFRNPLYALVALAPNVLPILIVTGLMGWTGVKINMGAAMIAAVSMGLSIDSSIHYITSFQRALGAGKSVHEAVSTVHDSVGRAIVFSTLALIVGFSVLATSQFIPTIYFGVLVSLTMLGGLAGNLFVLPVLLKWATRRRPATQSAQPAQSEVSNG